MSKLDTIAFLLAVSLGPCASAQQAALAGAMRSGAGAVSPLPHLVSVGVRVDADGDRFDDVLLFEGTSPWLYTGQAAFPYQRRRGPVLPRLHDWRFVLADTPVFDGEHLYVPCLDYTRHEFPKAWIFVASRRDGLRKLVGSVELPPFTPRKEFAVESLRIAPLGGGRGIAAVAVERNTLAGGEIRYWELHGTRRSAPRILPRPKHWPAGARIADLVPLRGYTRPDGSSRDRLLLAVYSSVPRPDRIDFAGFGWQSIEDGVATGSAWNFGPPLQGGGADFAMSAVAAADRTPLFRHTQLALRTHRYGPHLLPDGPWNGVIVWARARSAPPHVELAYSPMPMPSGHFLPGAVADYDGDGGQEFVYATPGLAAVADLDVSHRYAQLVELLAHGSDAKHHAVAGVAGDFNGDGHRDLLLVTMHLLSEPVPVTATPVLLLGSHRPGRPALHRAY